MNTKNLNLQSFTFAPLVLIMGLLCLASCQNTPPANPNGKPMFVNLDAPAFDKKFKETDNAYLLDVRTPAELADGSIEGHVMIDYNDADFQSKIDDLDTSRPAFIYCRSGGRSVRACMALSDLGFTELYNLEGGIQAWNDYKGR